MTDSGKHRRLFDAVADDSFHERIQIVREAGRGGMGVVFEAVGEDGQRLAVKKLSRASHIDERRFLSEAEALESLDHEAIVGYVEHGATVDGEHYLVMDWLDGRSLAERIATDGPLSAEETIALARRICSALGYAHDRGIVHRDLKPSNIILVNDQCEEAVLVDFGIARVVAAPSSLTDSGQLIGTPGYCSPEQIRGGETLDGRSDLFALGCVIYECLAGEPAFGGDDLLAVLARVLLESPRALSGDVPTSLGDLLVDLLKKERERRPESAQVVDSRLRAVGLGSVGEVVFDAELIKTRRVKLSPLPAAVATGKSKRLQWLLGAGALAVAGVGVALIAGRGEPAGPCDRDRRAGCERRCANGDAEACYRQGQGLAYGLGGLRRDKAKAKEYLLEACEGGVGRGCYEAATQVVSGGVNTPAANGDFEALLVRGCELGFASACRKLAAELDERERLTKDLARARAFAARGCELFDEFSCERYARYLDDGVGGPADSAEAATVRSDSCARGHTRACR